MADSPPADGRRPDHRLGAFVETIETGEQQFVEAGRDAPLAGDSGELLGKERVAIGTLEYGADERVRWLRSENSTQLLGDVSRAEWREAKVFDAFGAVEFGEQPTNRVASLETIEPVGGHEHHAGQRRPTGEDREQVACRPVSPVHVLDDENHGPLAGDSTQRRGKRLRRSSTRLLAELEEDLVDRGIWRPAIGHVEAVPGHDERAGGRGPLVQLGDEARLTDPRVPAHEHGRRRPGNRCFEGNDQVSQLFGASDEPRTRHPCGHRSSPCHGAVPQPSTTTVVQPARRRRRHYPQGCRRSSDPALRTDPAMVRPPSIRGPAAPRRRTRAEGEREHAYRERLRRLGHAGAGTE